ncbi:MAG: response regulator [Chthoniobacter sp.]
MKKLLLVEDNEMNRDMLSRRLERRGYEVLIAVDGEQGIAAAREHRPDLILMDMSLPVLDGWESTRRLKQAPDTQGFRSWRSTRTRWPGNATRRSRPVATTMTPNPWILSGCSARSKISFHRERREHPIR